jgi:anti-sigma factor RsiW
MRHHDIAEWIDYVRGLGDPDLRIEMEAHLRAGCPACRETVTGLESLSAELLADEAYEPPPGAVRCARALFSRFHAESVRRLPRVLARLVQDSLGEPLPAGVRGNERASRQALYEVGNLYVDLRVEQRPGRSSVEIVGQMLRREATGEPAWRRPVVLTSGRRVLACVASNEHGEFHFDGVPAGQVRIHIPVDDGSRQIEIALGPLMASAGRRRH